MPSSVSVMVRQQTERWKFTGGNGGGSAVKGVKGMKGRKFNANQRVNDDDDDDENDGNGVKADDDGKEFNIDDRFVCFL